MKRVLLTATFRNRPLHELHGGWCERGRSLDLPYSIISCSLELFLSFKHWLICAILSKNKAYKGKILSYR